MSFISINMHPIISLPHVAIEPWKRNVLLKDLSTSLETPPAEFRDYLSTVLQTLLCRLEAWLARLYYRLCKFFVIKLCLTSDPGSQLAHGNVVIGAV